MLVELYRRYREALDTIVHGAQPVGYNWGKLPDPLNGAWLPYSEMFNEFSREIANSLNELNDYSLRLKAWNTVIAPMNDQEKVDAVHEFIDPIATIGLNLPYVIRSRLIFAAAHLSHQANRSREGASWRDNFPLDNEVYFAAADKFVAPWQSYAPFKRCVEKFGSKQYQTATRDFRNAYNHRFSPRFVIGITQIVTRKTDDEAKSVTYSFGGMPALSLDFVAGLLDEQYRRGSEAFFAFQALVREHEASISKDNIV
ncbi:integrase [Bradyrhizobium sp. UFLA05-153]